MVLPNDGASLVGTERNGKFRKMRADSIKRAKLFRNPTVLALSKFQSVMPKNKKLEEESSSP